MSSIRGACHEASTSWQGLGEFVFWSLAVVAAFYALTLCFLPLYIKTKHRILQKNEVDYKVSFDLQSALTSLVEPPLHEYPIGGSQIPGTWRVFRVEHVPAQILRGEFSADLNLFKVIFGGSSRFRGETFQTSVSNLIDTSSLLFAKNADGGTLRIIVPSPNSIVELLGNCIGNVKSELIRDGHTWKVMSDFTYGDWMHQSLQKAKVIDTLDAERERPEDSRTPIEVFGLEVRPGIVMTSKFIVGGKQVLCFPSGFFQSFTERISGATNIKFLADTTSVAV